MPKTNNKLDSRNAKAVKKLPDKMARLVAITAASLLAMIGFGLVAYGSSHEDPELTFTENLFELITRQRDLTIVADTLERNTFPWTHNRIYWKHKIVDVGENCDENTFKGYAPNHPEIRKSRVRELPQSPDAQAAYRNKWICFEARSGDRVRHILHDIDTGNPVVSVKRVAAFKSPYLQASASESVSYRVGRVRAAMTRTSVFAEPSYPWLQAGTACEQMFKGNYIASYYEGDEYVTEPLQFEEITTGGRVPIIIVRENDNPNSSDQFVDFIYCFEATDADGNQTYVQVRPNRGPIVYVKSQHIFSDRGTDGTTTAHFRLLNVSGYVDWTIAVLPEAEPGDSADCSVAEYYDIGKAPPSSRNYRARAGDFDDNPFWVQGYLWAGGIPPAIYMPGYRVQEDYLAGRDYCVRAIDQLGNYYYKLVEKTGTPKSPELLPPVVSISTVEGFTVDTEHVQIRADSEITYFEYLYLTPHMSQRYGCNSLAFVELSAKTVAGQSYFWTIGESYDTICVRALGLDGQWGYASWQF